MRDPAVTLAPAPPDSAPAVPGLEAAFVAAERLFDRAFGARANPLRNLGALGFLLFWVLAASGIYLYIRFDTSVAGAYESIGALTRDEWYFGGVLRSAHRYAADAFVVVTLLHLAREFAAGRFRRFRAFSWISGVPLLWLLYASGVVGYWLVWDARAQFSALATAEWLDGLKLGAEPMARNFIGAESVADRLFSLFVFLHIGLPLALLAGMWVHVQRLGRPRTAPPRALALGTLGMLLGAALARPAASEIPWDPQRLPALIEMDWIVLFVHPLMYATSPQTLWLLAGALTAALVALPWLARGRAPVAAQVSALNCNGCGRCAADCPYEAVLLGPRSDGRPGALARVMPERCAACGICAGACPSSTPFRSVGELISGIELPELSVQAQRQLLEQGLGRLSGAGRVAVFGCDSAANVASLSDRATAAMSLRCIAMLPPSFIEYALRAGAEGVLVVGCRDGECRYRLGIELTEARLASEREPHLRASVPRERVRSIGLAPGDEATLARTLEDFRAELARLAPGRAPVPKRKAAHG
jgi:coenzyme F420-reducing hydrogenase delta subunit/ferredoxin